MAFHTVLTPPADEDEANDPTRRMERAVFLKDGFVLSAFVFTGLWLLSKRLWLWAAVFALVWGLLAFGGPRIGLHPLALAAAQMAIGLFLGLEGNALVERKLLRQGWTLAGVVEGAKLDTVERRFFESAEAQAGAPAANPVAAALARLQMQQGPQAAGGPVVGLFPDPHGSPR